ncbi:hypothetical protein ANCCAN_28484 [Ancylostoma caninum]|uniref:Uncharacterized protein n=1 Tax=Ancylostoma caninum TaxID=29170 RepID=A0A368F153_ANCCA|nr:hypothetical protein ANCCAN_28484 [Ancylostoma caninum]
MGFSGEDNISKKRRKKLTSLRTKQIQKTWPCRNRDDLRELILINRVAEKAFSHLFPPIKP